MSIHDDIQQTIRSIVCELDAENVATTSPALVADRTYARYGDPHADVHVRYLSIEHAKQMARRILGAKYGVDGDENPAHQGDMFSGVLQDRYPIRRKAGADAGYKMRHLMTDPDLLWVADQLDKSADARRGHADGIRAYVKSRVPLEPA